MVGSSEREIRVRSERPGDAPGIHAVVVDAFPTDAEARLVAKLRDVARPRVSLVAVDASEGVVGHVLFTPVELVAAPRATPGFGLAPLAVRGGHQRRGIGSALVAAGLSACRAIGGAWVVVLGHPDYYPRFGFRPAWEVGLYYERPGPNPACMVVELEPSALRGLRGEVGYHPAFTTLAESSPP
jgi:putative acetyltransferase